MSEIAFSVEKWLWSSTAIFSILSFALLSIYCDELDDIPPEGACDYPPDSEFCKQKLELDYLKLEMWAPDS